MQTRFIGGGERSEDLGQGEVTQKGGAIGRRGRDREQRARRESAKNREESGSWGGFFLFVVHTWCT